ncbi:hypothetical protein D1AOALGA4SA_4214 [Olavius algarvensis Delta 1 endosymbiont]|nr:hypothetical protein D1AOALGA4SA_4214 [Olavius algarvensis Delta 1 endosymbiont]
MSKTVGTVILAYDEIQNNGGECFGHWILNFEIYLKFGA